MTKIVDIDNVKGYDSVEGYLIYPPCCSEDIKHTISLSSIIKNGRCWHCDTEIDVKLSFND